MFWCPKVLKPLIYQGFPWAPLWVSVIVTGVKIGDI
ncbi:hypothetical protein PP242_gp39 [Streptococcus phage P7602]|uniref:Uncharacterized protein n=1 Tax=Streptococcus phage P7602 TaxID=1971432 RepID=A0A286QQ39_9CAUD|nr:hypothetical protein PP242_gp39 [Streptococcus phage P7602]ARU14031.1 hypothetical protein P7602_39 [Streptococcus phage P7602]